jgi:hypothetical protein
MNHNACFGVLCLGLLAACASSLEPEELEGAGGRSDSVAPPAIGEDRAGASEADGSFERHGASAGTPGTAGSSGAAGDAGSAGASGADGSGGRGGVPATGGFNGTGSLSGTGSDPCGPPPALNGAFTFLTYNVAGLRTVAPGPPAPPC